MQKCVYINGCTLHVFQHCLNSQYAYELSETHRVTYATPSTLTYIQLGSTIAPTATVYYIVATHFIQSRIDDIGWVDLTAPEIDSELHRLAVSDRIYVLLKTEMAIGNE